MGWNYRVVYNKMYNGEDEYCIREIYFHDDDDKIYAFSGDKISICGDSIDELKSTCEDILKCLDKPILDIKDVRKVCSSK